MSPQDSLYQKVRNCVFCYSYSEKTGHGVNDNSNFYYKRRPTPLNRLSYLSHTIDHTYDLLFCTLTHRTSD